MCCMMSHGMDHGAETKRSGVEGGHHESLADVLRRRYALGEITQVQLEEMMAALGLSEPKAVGAAAGGGNPWEAEHKG